MLTEEKKFFIKNGDITQPFIQIKMINPALVVVSFSNLATVPPDVEINEVTYDAHVASNKAASLLQVDTVLTGVASTRAALLSSASPTLLGIGLSQPEIDAMFAR